MIVRYADISDAEMITRNNVLLAKESENVSVDYVTVSKGVKALLSDKTKGFYIIAEEANTIIGQMMVTFEWSDWYNKNIWWLQSVYVVRSWRKKGVFKKLFGDISMIARKNNVDVLRLYVYDKNSKAKEVYSTIGMKKKPYTIYQKLLKS
jgi:GNAT superfamily N-acetyltransferase